MTQASFWDLIDQSRKTIHINFESQCAHLTDLLTELNDDAIIGFDQILCELLEEANTWEMMAASFVVCSFISDETYEDFRAWCIGQGQENFYKILKDPNFICQLITPNQVKEMGGEHMLFVGLNAYLQKKNEDTEEAEIAYFEQINKPEEKIVEQRWPESKNEYRKMFPKLFDTFWNEARIKTLLEEAEKNEA